ncbi:MAG: VCBS repeat-containing protein [Pirellulales bacterium]
MTCRAGEAWVRHAIDDYSSQGADGANFADVDGDGRLDVTTPWENGGIVRVYFQPAAPEVARAWPAVNVGKVGSPEDAVFVDLDGDGNFDVLSCCEGATRCLFVHWAPADRLKYQAPDSWTTSVIPTTQGWQWMTALPTQIDGKNGVDLIVGGKGTNAVIAWLESPENPRDLESWKLHPIYDAGWIMTLRAIDMDDDGDLDVLSSDRRKGRIVWLKNPGKDSPKLRDSWSVHEIGEKLGEVMFLDVADLDGDHVDEIVVAVKDNDIACLRRKSVSKSMWTTQRIPMPLNCGTGKGVAVGDVNLDGRQDIVFSCENANGGRSGLRWLQCDGDFDSGRWIDHEVSGPDGTKFDLVRMIDLDDDGDLDVVTCEERKNLGLIWYENPTRRRTSIGSGP